LRRANRQGLELETISRAQLNDFEKASLVQMRKEEKLARDVYLTLGEKYSLPVFTNIPRSEQRHMDQIAVLLARYDIEDPIQDDRRGKFNSPAMQELYNDLVTRGSASEAEALKVGATIEDLDIHDLETALQGGVDNQDIALVYRNLAKGSRNHIRAFNTQLSARGQTYSAQHITQADLDAILAGGHERGPADGQQMAGRGQGKGRSKGRGRP
jgi:hypothetical protein